MDEQLDNELLKIDYKTEEGLEKIKEARLLLPKHYASLVDDIGGEITTDFDIDRLPLNIKAMVEIFEIEAPSLGILTNTMVASMAYANLFGKFRPYIRDVMVSKKTDIPANIFAISFAATGLGKNLSFDLGETILKKSTDLVLDRMKLEAENKAKRIAIYKAKKAQEKAKIPKDKQVDDDSLWYDFYKEPHSGYIKSATYEGLLATAEDISRGGELGNLFIAMSELGNSLKLDPNIDRLIMILAELYDVGKVPEDLKKTKELKTGAIEGLAPSLLAHTSPAPLVRDDKLVEKLKNIISSYFGRRAYVLFTTVAETVENINLSEDIEQQVKDMLESTFKSVEQISTLETLGVESTKRLLKDTQLAKITLTDNARLLYGKYFLLNKDYRRLAYMKDIAFADEGMVAEITNRSWRSIKLAGQWALAQNTSVIDKQLLSSAIYFTEFAGKGLRKLMDLIDLEVHERFIKAIEEQDIGHTIRFDQLIKQGYIKRADKIQINNLLVAVNSGLGDKAVVLANYKKSILTIERIIEATGNYSISVLKFKPNMSKDGREAVAFKGYKYYKGLDLQAIKKVLENDCAYIPFELTRGYRNDDNVKGTTNYVALDIDESELDIDTLHKTYLSGTLHIIATTSNKDNMFKFRLIVPIKQEIGDNNQIYKYILQRIADELMLKIDLRGRSQFMNAYKGGYILDNLDSGIEPMDIASFIKDASTEVKAQDYNSKLTPKEQKKLYDGIKHDMETVMGFAIYAKNGFGSISLYKAVKLMQQASMTKEEIVTTIHKINNMWVNPMPIKRLESTILNHIVR